MRERLKLIKEDKNRGNDRKSMKEEFGTAEVRREKRTEEREAIRERLKLIKEDKAREKEKFHGSMNCYGNGEEK